MRSPLSQRAVLGLVLPMTVLIAAPSAQAAPGLKVPVPAAGHVAVGVAKAPKGAKLRITGKVPAGAVVLGSVTPKGRAVVAVARLSAGAGATSVSVTARRGRLTAPAVLPAALTTKGAGLGPACAGAAPALGRVLGRNGATLRGADARRLGALLAGALCGRPLDDAARSFLSRLGITAAGGGASPAGPIVAPPAAASSAAKPSVPSIGADTRPGGTTTPPPPAGTTACTDGIDNDGDGQIDDAAQWATFVDPGCSSPDDTSEEGETTLTQQCGLGIYTRNTATGFGVDFDSLSTPGCPRSMAKGIVDLPFAVNDCTRGGYLGDVLGICLVISGNAMQTGDRGDQWFAEGTASQSLCGKQAWLLAFDTAGRAYEYKATVFDGAEVCPGGPPPGPAARCANGVDDDGDGQVDHAGGGAMGADPGCTEDLDSSEDSEVAFPAGCVAAVAHKPGVSGRVGAVIGTTDGGTCPTFDRVWIDLDTEITACVIPYWGLNEQPSGACGLATGGTATGSGDSGNLFSTIVDITGAADCSISGTMAVRAMSGTVHEAAILPAYYDDADAIQLC